MIKDVKTLIEAKRLAMADTALQGSLREWHMHKGAFSSVASDYCFDDWIYWMLGEMSDGVGVDYPEFPTPDALAAALRIQAMGDVVSVKAADIAEQAGFVTDVNCHVEDGIVYSSIWLKGKDAEGVKKYADDLSDKFKRLGYSAEVSVDEEDDHEVFVNAQLDFRLYKTMVERGMCPKCLLCGCQLK